MPDDGPRPPLISVITPTWQRHQLLLERCIPSVQAQTHPGVEHIVVSDGPDPELSWRLHPNGQPHRGLWYRELPEHDPEEHWGAAARLAGLEYASGDLITYCDDDDALRPDHCALMAAALDESPDAGFAVSRMVARGGPHGTVVGWGPLTAGNVGSPMIMHRKSILDTATWGESSWIEDWLLVSAWLAAGVQYVNVSAETADVWPSRYRKRLCQGRLSLLAGMW